MKASHAELDAVFRALANPSRRTIVERLLESGSCTVGELAEPLDMALPSVLEHIRLMERSGLVSTRKRGRVREVRAVPESLRSPLKWLDAQRSLWEQRLKQLDEYVESMAEGS